jgi:cytochrome b561
VGLAALHVAAALKHQFADRDEVMAHMVPGLKTQTAAPAKSAGRNAVLGFGFAIIAVCVAALAYALLTLAPAAAAVPAPAHHAASHAAPTHAAPGPPSWAVVPASSAIHFTASVTSDGNVRQITGQFTGWQAAIKFDPADLAHSSAHVVINTASARDGVPFDETYLPNRDFFDTAHFPTAEFQSTSMRRAGAGYEAVGSLTIKGHAIPMTMPFTVTVTGNHAVMDAHFSIRRADAGLGTTDHDADQALSPAIGVNVHVEANHG